jgi:hypothetical protein
MDPLRMALSIGGIDPAIGFGQVGDAGMGV